jgi:hypothetical protein
MEFKEIINAIRQYPWQVTVAVISLIPLYIIDLKFLAKRKVGLSRKIEIAKERGHVTKGMIIKKMQKESRSTGQIPTTITGRQGILTR